MPANAMPGSDLTAGLFDLLCRVHETLPTLPPLARENSPLRSIGRAVDAGPRGAHAVIAATGGALVASALLEASATFRSTGHFPQADELERLAFVVAGWERRSRPRKRG